MQKIKKPVSILLVFMMIVSLFAIVPFSAGAATTYNSGGVHAEDLVAGDVITDNIDGFDPYGYSFVLKAGTFGAGFNTNMISDVLSDDLEISENDFSCSIPNGLLILDLSTFTSYYPLDENGDYSGKFYVWDVTGTTITLGGYAAPAPADPTANEPTGLTATYGQRLSDVTLTNPAGNTPGTWSWNSPSTSVGDVGSHTFPATFTPNDTSSYKTVQKNLTVTVTAPAPVKLILNVGENGKVVMDNGTFGNATDASNIVDITAPLNVTDGSKVFIVDDHTVNILEGGSINIATGGEVSFYPSADNTGVITAIPDEGYICTGWYNGDTLYSSDAALSYQSISEDITLTAKFAPVEIFAGHSVTLGGDIGVNFYLDSAVLDTYSGTKTVKFTCDGEETTVDVPAIPTANGYKVTRNVVAAQMAHTITATLYVDDEAVDTDDYSVQQYAETVYAKPGDYTTADKADALKVLAAAMLHYGAMAQTVFAGSLKETPDHLADVNMPAADFSGATAENIAAAIKGSASDLNTAASAFDAEFYTSSLIYLSRNTLRLYFTPASKTVGALNGLDFSGNLSEYYYYVDVENIAAAELDNQQTFSVNGTEFTFSALDYACAVVNSDKMDDSTQKNLARALYLYNQAANAYFDAAPAPVQNIVDLSTRTGDYEAQDGDILTGTLSGNKQITVAAGATITLRNVTITGLSGYFAGITPLGNATIILEGTNTVKGGYEDYPGIRAAQNATLTIDGTGSLDASSNGYGCGIGGGYGIAAGNIVINGGTITATGGEWATGIGSGYEAGCGDITINGGTITATGGEGAAGIGSSGYGSCGAITITGGTVNATGAMYGAGIGSGCRASCGNITIAATVTQVTATAGEDAASIGKGYLASCGTITIAPGANVTQN